MMQKDAGRSFWSRQGLCIMTDGRYLQYTQDMQMHIITCMESNKRISMKIQKAEHLESAFFYVH